MAILEILLCVMILLKILLLSQELTKTSVLLLIRKLVTIALVAPIHTSRSIQPLA